jgi:flagellar biosynthetic protein FlhB
MAEQKNEDQEDKTESPSEHKLHEAQKKGDFPLSKDLSLAVMLLASIICIFLIFPVLSQNLVLKLRGIIEQAHIFSISAHHTSNIAESLFKSIIPNFLMLSLVFVIAAIAVTYGQTRLKSKEKALLPKLEHISPLKGFKRLFSLKSLVETLKSTLKLFLIGSILYFLIKDDLILISETTGGHVFSSLKLLWEICLKLFLTALLFQVILGAADYLYQKYEYTKRLKMTKQEQKEEHKEMEGDPHVKGKRRSLQKANAKNRMMDNVKDATVIITNPTHYAIALKYELKVNKAPIVVAKGRGFIAKRIRELALKNSVELFSNPPLARALYKLPLNKEIPSEFYKAVADIIRYVFQKRKR